MYPPFVLAHEVRDKFFNLEPLTRRIDRILELGERFNARFTFFVTAANVTATNHDLLTRIAAHGHELGSHSFDHVPFAEIGVAAAHAQIHRSVSVLSRYGKISGFRAPYLWANEATDDACAQLGLIYSSSHSGSAAPHRRSDSLWRVPVTRPMDYEVVQLERRLRTREIIDRWASFAAPGEILLFHPWRLGSRRYIAALERILASGNTFRSIMERLDDPRACCVTFDLDFLQTRQLYAHTLRHLYRSPHIHAGTRGPK